MERWYIAIIGEFIFFFLAFGLIFFKMPTAGFFAALGIPAVCVWYIEKELRPK